jgi:hypothetical protein
MYPINRRFCELCLALEIVARDEGTKEFYETLRGHVRELIDNSYELTDGVLRVERLRNQGPAWSLHSELASNVFPSMAAIDTGRVSVLAPLGAALIGGLEGEQVAWQTPRGARQLQVERVVYQPEAAGRFDL